MAKWPQAGEVKTRLLPALPAAEVAHLYEQFLLDKVAQVRELRQAHPVIAFTPDSARAAFARMAPDFSLLPQRGHDLGRRLLNGIRDLHAEGFAGVMMVDSDTPNLPLVFLQRAIDVLVSDSPDAILGPTEDGGYYLIGMRRPHPELFQDIPWSTNRVLRETLRRADAGGLTTGCLPSWFDVDTPDDLRRLEAALALSPGSAPHTGRFLARSVSRASHLVAEGPR